MIPWWASVDRDAMTVLSCPPPSVPVETNTPAYLPQSAPDAQSWPVESQNALNCAEKLPYLREPRYYQSRLASPERGRHAPSLSLFA